MGHKKTKKIRHLAWMKQGRKFALRIAEYPWGHGGLLKNEFSAGWRLWAIKANSGCQACTLIPFPENRSRGTVLVLKLFTGLREGNTSRKKKQEHKTKRIVWMIRLAVGNGNLRLGHSPDRRDGLEEVSSQIAPFSILSRVILP